MSKYEFLQKFSLDTRAIKEFEHWIVCIRAKQVTVGAAIIALKRECPSIGMMSAEEALEFPKVIKWYEELCTRRFGAVKFNYLAVMLKECFVHYHAFPRYDKDVELLGKTWKDADWPFVVNIRVGESYEDEMLGRIIKFMHEDELV